SHGSGLEEVGVALNDLSMIRPEYVDSVSWAMIFMSLVHLGSAQTTE
ncbi:MAG: hypothetical protein RLY58_2433, partial [Pseudomonadota bacterium]